MSPASSQKIEEQIITLIQKLPLKEQKKWKPIRRQAHPALGKHIADLFRTNPHNAFTTSQIANTMTQELGSTISTGSAYYHCQKLLLSQDICRIGNEYRYRRILHLTCVDPADTDIRRTFISEGGRKYYLQLDPFGQLRWITENPQTLSWMALPYDVRCVLS